VRTYRLCKSAVHIIRAELVETAGVFQLSEGLYDRLCGDLPRPAGRRLAVSDIKCFAIEQDALAAELALAGHPDGGWRAPGRQRSSKPRQQGCKPLRIGSSHRWPPVHEFFLGVSLCSRSQPVVRARL
jgi:hypothetical protein